jgi:predicted alpha/beta hydrolase
MKMALTPAPVRDRIGSCHAARQRRTASSGWHQDQSKGASLLTQAAQWRRASESGEEGLALRVHKLLAADGVSISATFHGEARPQGQIKGAVLVVCAMGATQRYYEPFAVWLEQQGYLVATFDYRGMGLSRPERLRGFQADVLTWARLDCAAVLDALRARAAGAPLYWIGHSLGGQIMPLVPGSETVVRVVMVCSGSGYWRENAPGLRRRVPLLWHLVAPASTAICGYFPGRVLGIVGDLPAGVLFQWRRWCLHREYLLGEGTWVRERFAAVATPVVLFSVTDDEVMSERSIESLRGWLMRAPTAARRLSPQALGVPRIGHFGFFRPGFERSIWQALLLPQLSGVSPDATFQ